VMIKKEEKNNIYRNVICVYINTVPIVNGSTVE